MRTCHSITPKLYTSAALLGGPPSNTSGARWTVLPEQGSSSSSSRQRLAHCQHGMSAAGATGDPDWHKPGAHKLRRHGAMRGVHSIMPLHTPITLLTTLQVL